MGVAASRWSSCDVEREESLRIECGSIPIFRGQGDEKEPALEPEKERSGRIGDLRVSSEAKGKRCFKDDRTTSIRCC